MKQRVRIIAEGRVQGVCFRAEAQRQASGFHITGWVRNLPDGRVEALCEGSQDDVEQMIEWCRRGPRFASVNHIDVAYEPYEGIFDIFSIR